MDPVHCVVPVASWCVAGEGRTRFFLLPPLPLLTTTLGSGGLLTLTLRGKAMDGLEEQQGRTRPQLSHRAWKPGGTDAVFPQRQQAGGAPSRGFTRSRLFSMKGNERAVESERGSDRLRSLPPSTFHAARDIPGHQPSADSRGSIMRARVSASVCGADCTYFDIARRVSRRSGAFVTVPPDKARQGMPSDVDCPHSMTRRFAQSTNSC